MVSCECDVVTRRGTKLIDQLSHKLNAPKGNAIFQLRQKLSDFA